jgi:hypothetical protein
MKETKKKIAITAPNFQRAHFHIIGTSPLVVKRFSQKTKQGFWDDRFGPKDKTIRKKKKVTTETPEELFDQARYRLKKGLQDGIHAASVRNAMIRACSLVGLTMVQARMTIFAEADGVDYLEPQIPLIRILQKPKLQSDIVRIGPKKVPDISIRPAYHDWAMDIRLSWDADQFTLQDVINLMLRVGLQVGLCEGRPSSPNSGGMGWGLFRIETVKAESYRAAPSISMKSA